MENITYSITGGIEALDITVIEGYNQPTARCTITTPDYGGLGLGDSIEVSLGFDSSNGKVFEGFVQNITSERMPGYHTIEAEDVLIKAVEHLMVTEDLENPFTRTNITAEDLVQDVLTEAGISSYTGDATGFTFATGEVPVEFQLTFAWDAIQMVADVVAWHCWADTSGTVHFEDIDPVPGSSSATLDTGASGEILQSNRSVSTDNLRNKVAVFGIPPIVAIDSASSPYLPAGFYKTAVISSHLIDTQSMADTTASYNLSKWNRLTENTSLEALGNYSIHARDTVTVSESFSGASGDWFVYAITHTLSDTYTIRLNLVK
jgi:hypothetical protein